MTRHVRILVAFVIGAVLAGTAPTAQATDGRIYPVGLGSSSRIAFKYAWVGNCGDGWNSSIISLEGLRY